MAASSSSSSAAAGKEYDVFISFRGEDTREGFVSHLYKALCGDSIKAFIDYDLPKGDDTAPALIQAIKDSYGSVVVFSQNYASSTWCLNELLTILECKEQGGHFVLPVFYRIDPSHVRKQTGSYREAFAAHEQDPKKKTLLQKWRDALREAANIVGWDSLSRNHRDESELILNIVKDLSQKLGQIYQLSERGLVGIDKRCEHIEALLQKFPIVGIWGMGGIGKTTLAKAVFDKLSSQYDNCCFFENIREESQVKGPNQLLGKLLCKLLNDDKILTNLDEVKGLKCAMRRLINKKVFIVLDDVDNFKQLKLLGQEYKSFGPESRVIITTRHKDSLTSVTYEDQIYEVEGLNVVESLELFRSKAFNEHFPEKGYEEITKKFVSYAQGIPLALEILGSFLHSKTRKEWESAWSRLKKSPHKDIEKVLRLSFDGLNYIEDQQIFLDIAFFFKGGNKEYVISLLDSFGFDGDIGIRNLQDRALISISYGNEVQMHDLIQEMGWQIVREESIGEPGKRSRLRNFEGYDVLKYNEGTDAVQGISLDMSQIEDLHLSTNTFKKMTNLRYLNFYFSNWEKLGEIQLDLNTQLYSNKLRYLHWYKCPLWSLSSNFCAEKLVKLSMWGSQIKRLWNGVQDLKSLKELDLGHCQQLIELPDFSKASSLKSVKLSSCDNLYHIHPSILSSHTLKSLDVSFCRELRSLQSEAPLESLETLYMSDCPRLKKFSLSSEKLENLDFRGTAIEISGLCKNLQELWLGESLKSIRSVLSELTSVTYLQIEGSAELDSGNLQFIVGSLLSLREISLVNCKRLADIPELPASIEMVELIDCTSLETIRIPKSSRYFLPNCVKLDERALSRIMELAELRIKEAAAGIKQLDHGIFFPGNKAPSWFRYRKAQNRISIEIPPRSHLLGFAFYCIISPKVPKYELETCGGYCYLENNQSMISEGLFFEYLGELSYYPELISDHGHIWYDRRFCNRLFDKMNEQKAKGQRTKRLSFEFFVEDKDTGSSAIKECGLWPIYASEYDISTDDLVPREGFKLGYIADDIDEQVEPQLDELRPSTSATGFTTSIFDHQGQDITSHNGGQGLPEINSLCLLNRFNELDYSTNQMELNLGLGFGNKSKRFEHPPTDISMQNTLLDPTQMNSTHSLDRFGEFDNSISQFGQTGFYLDLNEMPTGGNSLDIHQQSSSLSLQLNQGHPQLNPFDIGNNSGLYTSSSFAGLPDIVQPAQVFGLNLNSFSELDSNIAQFDQSGFCPHLNEMPMGGNSLDTDDTDQQSLNLSLRLNQGHPQMNPFDVGANSGLYASSSSSNLLEIVQMAQADDVFGSSLCLKQEDPQMNLMKVSHQENQHEQDGISCSCFIDTRPSFTTINYKLKDGLP